MAWSYTPGEEAKLDYQGVGAAGWSQGNVLGGATSGGSTNVTYTVSSAGPAQVYNAAQVGM